MEKELKHTKMNSFQCYHNNTGYCKFGNRCKFQHYYALCPKQVCREISCKFRHPKSCKFAENCKFFKKSLCVYKHVDKEKDIDDHKNKEIKDLESEVKRLKSEFEEEIEMLKAEIVNLRLNIENKTKELAAIITNEEKISKHKDLELDKVKIESSARYRVLKSLEKENDTLKEEIKHLKATKLKSCKKCDETFVTDVNHKDIVETKDGKVIIQVEPVLENKTETEQANESDQLLPIEKSFKCERCGKILRSKSSLLEHKYRHCGVCGKLFQNIIQLKKHSSRPCSRPS